MPATKKSSSKPSSSIAQNGATPETLQADPVESAEVAGLRYVSDEMPGISRRRAGKGFTYINAQGETIKDEKVLNRIKALAIPPAYKNVWICPYQNGHLQAVGFDERGRKQYRYHEKWRQVRDENKYEKMIAFGQALPKIRRRTAKDLKQRGLPRTKVLAAIVQLLEKTMIRVGSEEYVQQNKSYGLTTMRNRHAEVKGSRVAFNFKGKSGVHHNIDLKDEELAHVVSKLQDLPGQELFQYVDEDGEIQSATSSDVNAYLKEITDQDFTAKDFRTWSGTVLASMALQEFEKFDSQTQAKKNLVQAIENVAERLGNTPSVCRKCYVHPAVIDAYLDGSMLESLQQQTETELKSTLRGLQAEEAAVLAFLQRRLESEVSHKSAKKSRTRRHNKK
jgi:DNA topoisomerase-1